MIRVAALADLRCRVEQAGFWADRLRPVNAEADLLLIAGDLTNSGSEAELEVLMADLQSVTIPVVTVLGDREYGGGRAWLLGDMLRRAGIHNIEGSSAEIRDITVVGGMGVEGGFGRGSRRSWSYGERQVMSRLRHYLGAAQTSHRIALLHYAPTATTLGKAGPRRQAVLGSSAMGMAIDEVGADLVIHGHVEDGLPEGRTEGGVPVYNVALPVLEHAGYRTPYRVITLDG